MRTRLQMVAFALSIFFGVQSQAQTADTIFPKGELSTAKNHTGNVWLKELNAGDSTFEYALAVATFDAGAKLDWHVHPGGQILLILEGTGYYQERGKAVQIVHKGDVIKCLPGVEHWRGGRCSVDQRLYLPGYHADAKGKNSLVRTCYRQGLWKRKVANKIRKSLT